MPPLPVAGVVVVVVGDGGDVVGLSVVDTSQSASGGKVLFTHRPCLSAPDGLSEDTIQGK